MPPSVNTVIFRLLLAVVLLAPLPLASYRPWAWSVLSVLVGALLLAWSAVVALGRARAPVPPERLAGVAAPFALALLWAVAQTLSATPPGWWHPLWAEAATALGGQASVEGAISLDRAMTWTAISRLASYGGVFWLAAQLGRERARAREAVVATAVAGLAYAIYGLAAHLAGWERIVWLAKWAYLDDLTSTFVNKNAYGAYAGLGVLCCLALFVNALRPRSSARARGATEMAETVLVRALPFLAAAAVIATALLLTHSRGAFLSTGLGVAVLLAAASAAGLVRFRAALILVVVAAGIGVLSLSGEVTVRRLAATATSSPAAAPVAEEARADLYRLTTVAILDAPLTGHGLGTFPSAFKMYRDTTLSTPVAWEFAHNVPLETAMDLGVPASGLLFLAMAAAVARCAGALVRRRRDQIHPALAIAAAALIGAHGLVDFSAQMPAVAVTLSLLMGIGVAQSWRTADLPQASAPAPASAPTTAS